MPGFIKKKIHYTKEGRQRKIHWGVTKQTPAARSRCVRPRWPTPRPGANALDEPVNQNGLR